MKLLWILAPLLLAHIGAVQGRWGRQGGFSPFGNSDGGRPSFSNIFSGNGNGGRPPFADILSAIKLRGQLPFGDNFEGTENLERPFYDVVISGDGYEVRDYEAATWACTNSSRGHRMKTGMKLFKRLFKYIQSEEMNMTVPVVKKLNGSETTMCFYLPENFQDSPPEPRSSKVYIKDMPAMTVAVRNITFPSNPFPGRRPRRLRRPTIDWTPQINELLDSLINDGITGFLNDTFCIAAYDPPFMPDAQIELWLPEMPQEEEF